MGRVLINDLVVRGIIGVNEAERKSPQEIVINVDLFTDLNPCRCDRRHRRLRRLSMGGRESHGSRRKSPGGSRSRARGGHRANRALREPGVERVMVRVEKPGAVGAAGSVGVEIERALGPLIGGSGSPAVGAALDRRRKARTTTEIAIFRGACELMSIEPPEPWRDRCPRPNPHLACLGLGLQRRPGLAPPRASSRLSKTVAVEAVSTAWESPAVGSDGPNFVNAALLCCTGCRKRACGHGSNRSRTGWAGSEHENRRQPLTIDIDIVILTVKSSKRPLEPGVPGSTRRRA